MKLKNGIAAAALSVTVVVSGISVQAADYLVKQMPGRALNSAQMDRLAQDGIKVESLGFNDWIRVTVSKASESRFSTARLQTLLSAEKIQPNRKWQMIQNPIYNDEATRTQVLNALQALEVNGGVNKLGAFRGPGTARPLMDQVPADNQAIPAAQGGFQTGMDTFFSSQWGMNTLGLSTAWNYSTGNDLIVAVIDTGVDYTHEDLGRNIWRNPGETGADSSGQDKAMNGIDDDGNGYIDDVVGWDFATNDNKPYDLIVPAFQLILGGFTGQGGNPGHGTHCAGNVGAIANNGVGIAGVAPNAKIMALRFLTEKGQGDDAGAIKSIKYAVDNGAKILSNSWGGPMDTSASGPDALREVIEYAEMHGVLFVAAAGNGDKMGKGYDIDAKDMILPGGYATNNVFTVAAMDNADALGAFSNWGSTSVDIGAPGVNVLSTVPKYGYEDVILDLSQLGVAQKVTWDGTSMATPHVAGAAALYWSLYPGKTYHEVKSALMNSSRKLPVLAGKTTSGGTLDTSNLYNF